MAASWSFLEMYYFTPCYSQWQLASLTFLKYVLILGESGVGKSAIIKDMLKSLEKDGGTTFKNGTILGSIFNFTDKNQTLLDNISSLTRLGGDQEGNLNFVSPNIQRE